MLAVIRDWWGGLNARERALIALAATLVTVLALNQFALAPLRDARARALGSYRTAVATLAEVRAGVAQAGPGEARVEPISEGALRGAVTASAAARGLSVSRMTPLSDGGLDVRVDSADPAELYQWLYELVSERGVDIRRASVRRADRTSAVQANILFAAGGGA